ncbi:MULTISPECIES: hypothetical protein [Mycolicibacter]|uniref:Lipoprotein n=2 Tax=Mycolicibacter TaxID=1073531 RepID=A0ABU5XL98_9MYCO|nr:MULTISPECIES: hypothetical protein [unclassified Mycolicibacter]MEB3023061.1 hypothetical protein [Mycolicibacter sp. MYC098]MEB3033571.1 hypothetical protein [Mycolicibacter sp. MYC340]
MIVSQLWPTVVGVASSEVKNSREGAISVTVEMFHDRNPDYECSMRLFVDGVETSFTEFSIDPSAGYEWSDWIESRAEDIANASPAVAAIIYEGALEDSPYLDGRPESQEQCERDLIEAINRARGG